MLLPGLAAADLDAVPDVLTEDDLALATLHPTTSGPGDGLMRLPDAYQVQTTSWGGQLRTPLFHPSHARHVPASSSGKARQAVSEAITAVYREASIVFVAGRTAPCCGRLIELAIIDARGKILFHKAFGPHNGEKTHKRGVEDFWPCSRLHDDPGTPASHWAPRFYAALRYRYQRPWKFPSDQRSWGHLRGGVVFWGLDVATAIIRELVYSNGHPRNGKRINTSAGLTDVPLIDLQQLDLAWRQVAAPTETLLSHLDGDDPLRECYMMRRHLRHMATADDDAQTHHRLAPHQSMVIAPRPSAPSAHEREGWSWRKDKYEHGVERMGRRTRADTPNHSQADHASAAPIPSRRRASGQGRGLTQPQRQAVEQHAVARATAHFTGQGWTVRDVGAFQPYDLHLTRDDEEVIVEVKGTTSAGETVILTRGEVEIHRRYFPRNALVVVHGIDLVRDPKNPLAGGGVLECVSPWRIHNEDLTPSTYTYRTALYPRSSS